MFWNLVCLSRVIFKESIGVQTRGSKKVKKRSIYSKLENVPMDAFFGTDTHMILLTAIDYDILTSEVIRGHWR